MLLFFSQSPGGGSGGTFSHSTGDRGFRSRRGNIYKCKHGYKYKRTILIWDFTIISCTKEITLYSAYFPQVLNMLPSSPCREGNPVSSSQAREMPFNVSIKNYIVYTHLRRALGSGPRKRTQLPDSFDSFSTRTSRSRARNSKKRSFDQWCHLTYFVARSGYFYSSKKLN